MGGIKDCSVTFQSGVTLLTGRNATNRTSLLRAVSGVLGGTSATLKSDTDEGYVSLTVNDKEYLRQYKRTETGVQVTGEPYEDNSELIDLFISLLEDNPARLAVERSDDLRELIMRPVDTTGIERRIRCLKEEREEVKDELDRVERRSKKLPKLEERRQTLTAELDSLEEVIRSLRAEVTEYEANVFAPFGRRLLLVGASILLSCDVDSVRVSRLATHRVDAARLPECHEHILGSCPSRTQVDCRFVATVG